MLRHTRASMLKHRPKDTLTEVSSNRYMPQALHEKFKEYFTPPPFTHKKVIHNWRYFQKPGKIVGAPQQDFTKIGIKLLDFSKAYQDRTKGVFNDDIELMVRVQIYFDKTFAWRLEPPPAAWYIMRAARLKRRESGPSPDRYVCYVTLEMLYEIAKMRQENWADPEAVPIEKRVRKLVYQCRRMGIAILGVDSPPQPVKGLTPQQYEKQSKEYREQQHKLWQEFQQKRLEAAPHLERLHRPNVNKLSFEQLQEMTTDPNLYDALWRATAPNSKNLKDLKNRDRALSYLRTKNWLSKDISLDEARSLFLNWRLPSLERARQTAGVVVDDAALDRDSLKDAAKSGAN